MGSKWSSKQLVFSTQNPVPHKKSTPSFQLVDLEPGKAAFGQVLYHDGELVVAIDLPLTSTTIDLYLLRTENAAVNCCETACPSAKDQQCWGKETERRYPENSQTANLQQQTWRAIFPGVSFGRYCLKLLEHTQVSTYDPIYTKIFDISSPSIGSPVEEWNVTFFIEQVFLNSERRSVRVAFEVDEEYQEELLDFQLELLCSDCDLTCGDPSSCQVITQEVNLNQKTEHVFTDVTGTYCCAMVRNIFSCQTL
ncbi:unnamed protein product [Darwinula stevensoni]|uniref:Uncharacterized protein n=1 Tax=Darwinula stevensoni TaxID=69355 RepID=A0A7R8XAX0_9CRUS|nr:unnamed protein product [Darwinula stevensoni]CAG0884201.1 unnamed protein product [Darwinula stevensoni]